MNPVTLDAITWTALVPPISCNYVEVLNSSGVGLKLRDAENLAGTEINIPAGERCLVGQTAPTGYRFLPATTALYGQLASGVGDVQVIWVR